MKGKSFFSLLKFFAPFLLMLREAVDCTIEICVGVIEEKDPEPGINSFVGSFFLPLLVEWVQPPTMVLGKLYCRRFSAGRGEFERKYDVYSYRFSICGRTVKL